MKLRLPTDDTKKLKSDKDGKDGLTPTQINKIIYSKTFIFITKKQWSSILTIKHGSRCTHYGNIKWQAPNLSERKLELDTAIFVMASAEQNRKSWHSNS